MSADERKLLTMEVVFGRKSHPNPSSLPDWPTSIADAFVVVEKIPDGIQITCYGTRYVVQNLGMSGAPFIGQGNLPELICLAALRAHGVEVE